MAMDNHKKTKSPYLFIQLKFLSLSFNMCARKIHKESPSRAVRFLVMRAHRILEAAPACFFYFLQS